MFKVKYVKWFTNLNHAMDLESNFTEMREAKNFVVAMAKIRTMESRSGPLDAIFGLFEIVIPN